MDVYQETCIRTLLRNVLTQDTLGIIDEEKQEEVCVQVGEKKISHLVNNILKIEYLWLDGASYIIPIQRAWNFPFPLPFLFSGHETGRRG